MARVLNLRASLAKSKIFCGHRMFKVAILGCPNVGKSTLFNELTRKHKAVIDDRPGVTRDYNEGLCDIRGDKVVVIDTPGWGYKDEFSAEVERNVASVLSVAQLVLLVVDSPVTKQDEVFSLWLRKNTNLPVILLLNKSEKEDVHYSYELGWSDSLEISGKYCKNLGRLRERIADYLVREQSVCSVAADEKAIRVAVVGRPNVGKSTFINKLIKANRVITSPIAGTTRDAIEIMWRYKEHGIVLIDTAGMRKRAKVDGAIESLSVGASIYSIRRSDVVILILDATRGFERQDLSIASLVLQEGRGLVIAINKSDASTQDNLLHIKNCCEHHFSRGVNTTVISALENNSFDRLIDLCISNYSLANSKISTVRLNNWLRDVVNRHEPPLSSRKTPIRLKFIVQVSNNPFIFKVFANIPEDITKAYMRYLTNDLRQEFGLRGVQVKIILQKNYNPYLSSV